MKPHPAQAICVPIYIDFIERNYLESNAQPEQNHTEGVIFNRWSNMTSFRSPQCRGWKMVTPSCNLAVIVNQDWNEKSGFEDIEFAHAGAQGAAVEA
jgi:hypothetical protein